MALRFLVESVFHIRSAR